MQKAKPIQTTHGAGWQIFCPACENTHTIKKDLWEFNGDLENPSFTPSLRLDGYLAEGLYGTCHSRIKEGQIEYLSDCSHKMAGKTVELPEIK